MNRHNFLKLSGLAALSLSACGSVIKAKNETFIGDCETTNDILGPFYRPDAPETNNLLIKGIPGTVITIKGVVKANCNSILENALVEIWHCDTEGKYDNESNKFLHRAVWKTNKAGEYAFKTILPGKYLNGKLYRPAHIHFRVTHPNCKELVSQVYFLGDPHIEQDPWASQSKAEKRILAIRPIGIDSSLELDFNIFLTNKS